MCEKMAVKERIINKGLELFKKNGYYNVTVDDIILAADTSKGGFYYYFKSKDELLIYWLPEMDIVYKEWYEQSDLSRSSKELLKEFNHIVLRNIEETSSPEMISCVYSTQLHMKDKGKISDANRSLYSVLHNLIREGQEKGEIKKTQSFREITKMFVTVQRGAIYEWALSDGAYGLENYGCIILDALVESIMVSPE